MGARRLGLKIEMKGLGGEGDVLWVKRLVTPENLIRIKTVVIMHQSIANTATTPGYRLNSFIKLTGSLENWLYLYYGQHKLSRAN